MATTTPVQGTSIGGNLYYDYPGSTTDTTGQTTAGTTTGKTAGTTSGTTAGTTTSTWTPNLPYYGALSNQASETALSNLQGILPGDVVGQMEQAAAERGISTGSYESPNANAALLRALGLTSLDLTSKGEQQYATLLQNAPRTTVGTTQQTTSGKTDQTTSGTTKGTQDGTTTSDLGFDQASALNALLAANYGANAGTAGKTAAAVPMITGGGGAPARAGTEAATPTVHFPNYGGGSSGPGNFGGGTVAQGGLVTGNTYGGGFGLDGSFTDPNTGTKYANYQAYLAAIGGEGAAAGQQSEVTTGPTRTDASGADWQQGDDGWWTNLTTGEISMSAPTAQAGQTGATAADQAASVLGPTADWTTAGFTDDDSSDTTD